MTRALISCAVLLVLGATPRADEATGGIPLEIRIVYAHGGTKHVDEGLEDLAKELGRLAFTAYELQDRARFRIETGASARMQLPNEAWMVVRAKGVAPDGKVRLELEVKQLKFKTTVSIAPNGIIAVGGPPYRDGVLILALRHMGRRPL